MTVEVGGAGTLGVSFETALGTFVAPTKWIPIRSETLQKMEGKIYGSNIRGSADRTSATQGYTWIEGDITFEVRPEVLLYFMYASRVVPVKSGAGPYNYVFTPAHVAKASTAAGATNRKTLSMLIQRSGLPRGYVGLSVGQLAFTIEDGMLMCTASMVGTDEATQSAGTPTWPTTEVVGPGDVTLEIPTASARADADTFSLTINDNLVRQNRLNGQRKAAYQNWGEREVTLSTEIDYETLTDYNTFINQTAQEITIKGVAAAATEEVNITINTAIQDSHVVNLPGLGDVVRASMEYHAIAPSTAAYEVEIITAASVT